MTILMCPALDKRPWPTLGIQVAAWMEAYLVHGPGDLRGRPYQLDDEKRGLIARAYEVHPKDSPQAGRRRFKRVGFSLRKGSSKTELMAAIAAAELHPEAPVRCRGWDGQGNPIGGGVTDPFLALVAYTAEQSDELAYGALLVMLGEGPLRDDFDVGLTRILRKGGDGKAVSLANAPDARDGARITFQGFDETHRFTLPRLREAHRTMLANIPKRRLADAWSLETTTAPSPGESSVAEHTMDYAKLVVAGAVPDPQLFFYHREASDKHDLTTKKGIRAAVLEASGPVAEWSDIDGIVAQWDDPTADKTYLERVWLNRVVRSTERAFDSVRWRELAEPERVIPDGEHITLGFDGARYKDATALIATHVLAGFQWPIGIWQRPPRLDEWEVPVHEVEAAVDEAFTRWRVWRMYCDPPYWETHIHQWAGKYGDERVLVWWTNRARQIGNAVRAYDAALRAGELSHSGDALFTEHVGNAVRRLLPVTDDEQRRLWTIQKERDDSPLKIDAAMAGVLSWEARMHALAEGVGQIKPSVYEERGFRVFGGAPVEPALAGAGA